jgi:hypothetical protein
VQEENLSAKTWGDAIFRKWEVSRVTRNIVIVVKERFEAFLLYRGAYKECNENEYVTAFYLLLQFLGRELFDLPVPQFHDQLKQVFGAFNVINTIYPSIYFNTTMTLEIMTQGVRNIEPTTFIKWLLIVNEAKRLLPNSRVNPSNFSLNVRQFNPIEVLHFLINFNTLEIVSDLVNQQALFLIKSPNFENIVPWALLRLVLRPECKEALAVISRHPAALCRHYESFKNYVSNAVLEPILKSCTSASSLKEMATNLF